MIAAAFVWHWVAPVVGAGGATAAVFATLQATPIAVALVTSGVTLFLGVLAWQSDQRQRRRDRETMANTNALTRIHRFTDQIQEQLTTERVESVAAHAETAEARRMVIEANTETLDARRDALRWEMGARALAIQVRESGLEPVFDPET